MMNSTHDLAGDPTDGNPTDTNTSGDYSHMLANLQIYLLTCIAKSALLFGDA